jgi:hypothetical protein
MSVKIALTLSPSSTTNLIANVSAWSVFLHTLRKIVDWQLITWKFVSSLSQTSGFAKNGHTCSLTSVFLWLSLGILCLIAPRCVGYCDKYHVLPVDCIWPAYHPMTGMLLCLLHCIIRIYRISDRRTVASWLQLWHFVRQIWSCLPCHHRRRFWAVISLLPWQEILSSTCVVWYLLKSFCRALACHNIEKSSRCLISLPQNLIAPDDILECST